MMYSHCIFAPSWGGWSREKCVMSSNCIFAPSLSPSVFDHVFPRCSLKQPARRADTFCAASPLSLDSYWLLAAKWRECGVFYAHAEIEELNAVRAAGWCTLEDREEESIASHVAAARVLQSVLRLR